MKTLETRQKLVFGVVECEKKLNFPVVFKLSEFESHLKPKKGQNGLRLGLKS